MGAINTILQTAIDAIEEVGKKDDYWNDGYHFKADTMTRSVEEGIVVDSTIRETTFGEATSNPKTYKSIKLVHWKYYIVDEKGTRGETIDFGSSSCYLENTFSTAKEAFEVKEKLIEDYREKLRSEITDVESLFRFPLNHCVIGNEYTDWYARAVYEEYIEKYKKGELK